MSDQPFESVRFGRYQLLEKLAVGGMAEIYRAKSLGVHGFEKPVVIKCILPELAEDDDFVRMFIDEAKVMVQLDHPKVVQVLDFGQEQGRYFIAMEYIRGIDCLALLRRCARAKLRPTTGTAVHVAAEVLDALAYAHNLAGPDGRPLRILHRDISPSNIFLSELGEVKLGDFGIAVSTAVEGRRAATRMKGKYGYMAPELVTGDTVDVRSDLFSVGVVLAEMLMIRRLFIAKREVEVLLKVRDADLGRLDRYGEHIPSDLREILDSALSRDPDHRYQDAASFRDALHRYLFDNRLMVHGHDVQRFLTRISVAAEEEPEEAAAAGEAPPPEEAAAAEEEAPPQASFQYSSRSGERVRVMQGGASEEQEERAPGGREAVVGRTRRLKLGPPPTPRPVPSALPGTGEVPRIGTEEAVDAAREVEPAAMGATYDFRIPDSDEHPGVVVPERTPRPEAPRRVAASRVSESLPSMQPDSEGQLEERSLVRLLFDFAIEEQTGLLALHVGEAVKEIYLVNGDPHYVASNLPEDLFGQYLVERGIITEGELAMALAMLPHFDGRLGSTLVGLKLLRPMEVLRHLTHQVRQKLINAFALEQGRYTYFDGRRYEQEAAPLGLDAFEMIGAGVLALPADVLERRLQPVIESRPTLVPSAVPPEAFRLGADARSIYGKLDGRLALSTLLGRYDNEEQRRLFLQVVYLFNEAGLVSAESSG